MENIKEFSNHMDYKLDLVLSLKFSKISFCDEEEEIHYDFEGGSYVVITYDVKDDSLLTLLCYYLGTNTSQLPSSFFSKIETEYGEEIPVTTLQNLQGKYLLPLGINIIKYIPNVSSTGAFSYAFRDCTSIIKAEISSSITLLGNQLFYGCSNLEYVKLHDNLRSVDNGVFSGCNIKYFELPKSFINMNANILGGNPILYITVDPDNHVYDSRNNCNAIIYTSTNELETGSSNTIIPDSVTSIGYNAFSGNKLLTEIEIPEGITSIGVTAFAGTGLTKIVFPNTLTSFYPNNTSFSNCSLKEITINTEAAMPTDSSSSSGVSLKEVYGSTVKKVNLGDNVTRISNYFLYNCSDTIKLNNGTNPTIFPKSLTTIGYGALGTNKWLKSIILPEGITEIRNNAFSGCPNLTDVTILATTPPTLGSTVFPSGIIIKVPKESESIYKLDSNWSAYLIQVVP